MIQSTLSFIWGLLGSALTILMSCLTWVYDMVYILHTSHPRLEGLLVGVLMTWILLKRDKHPVLKIISAPLKVVIDILDILWDQCVETLSDLLETVKRAILGSLRVVRDTVSGVYSRMLDSLVRLKERLKKSS